MMKYEKRNRCCKRFLHFSGIKNFLTLVFCREKTLVFLWFLQVMFFEYPVIGEEIKLKANDTITCTIVVPDEAGPVAQFAGKELQTLIIQSLGDNIQVSPNAEIGKAAIILGNSKELRESGVDISKLSRDGFVIKTHKGNILIAGRDSMKDNPEKAMPGGIWSMNFERGTLFGVYDFLERFMGVRFYFPGDIGTIIPRHRALSIPEIDISDNPDYTVRRISCFGLNAGTVDWMPTFNGEDTKWKSQMYYRWRFQTEYIPFNHGLSRLAYVERFSETHPEYFALLQDGRRHKEKDLPFTGQLCLSSGIREEIYKDAEAFLTGKEASTRNIKHSKYKNRSFWDPSGFQPGYFDMMPQDGFYPCRCEKCQQHYSKDIQAQSDYVWNLVIEIAEKLKKNGIPGYLTMLGAYESYKCLPSQAIPDNIKVMLALGGPWHMDKGDTLKYEIETIRAWKNKMNGKKTCLWNYANKYSGCAIPGIPSSTPKTIGKYYKTLSPYISGAYMQSNSEPIIIPEIFIQSYLNYYIFSKVAWKNSIDIDALLKDHYQKMFGNAALKMEEIFNVFEENWLAITGTPVNTPLGPQFIPLSDYGIWENVYSCSQIEKLKILFNKSEELTADDAEALKRVKFMRERFFEPVIKQREQYVKNQASINALHFYVKEIPYGEKINIDGKPDEPVWKTAEQISLVPHTSEKSKKENGIKTTVKGLRDGENIYFFFDCEEPEMDKLLSAKRKDNDKEIWRDSSIEVFMNPANDRNIYYQLIINADGSFLVLSLSAKGGLCSASKWDSGAVFHTVKGAKDWTVEIAIPLKNLPEIKHERNFPANFCRNRCLVKGTNDYAALFTWSPFLKNGFHDIDNFGYITFTESKLSNIIKNSSFNEEIKNNLLGGSGGWVLPPPSTLKESENFSVVNDPFSESGKALLMERKSIEKGHFVAVQHLPALEPDTEYQLTYAIKIEDLQLGKNKHTGVTVNIWDDKNQWFPQNYFTSDMPWTRQGFKFKTGPQTNKPPHKSYIALRIMEASCNVWFSDIKIIKK